MMRTHLYRLPEHYEQKYKEKYDNLDWNWIKELSTRRRMLVIDDETHITDAYRRVFSKDGLDVLTASNAIQANDLLAHEKVDIVLLDINMPEVDLK